MKKIKLAALICVPLIIFLIVWRACSTERVTNETALQKLYTLNGSNKWVTSIATGEIIYEYNSFTNTTLFDAVDRFLTEKKVVIHITYEVGYGYHLNQVPTDEKLSSNLIFETPTLIYFAAGPPKYIFGSTGMLVTDEELLQELQSAQANILANTEAEAANNMAKKEEAKEKAIQHFEKLKRDP